jgi:hypothetical protein
MIVWSLVPVISYWHANAGGEKLKAVAKDTGLFLKKHLGKFELQ